MKVINIVCFPFQQGGVESFLINIINNINLEDLQIDFFAVLGFENKNYKTLLEKKNSNVFIFDRRVNAFETIKSLNSILKNSDYDVVHIHSSNIRDLLLFSLISKFNKSLKTVAHVHSVGRFTLFHYLIKMISFFVFPFSIDVFCACSLAAGKSKYSRKSMKNLVILKNGIDLETFKTDNRKRIEYREKLKIKDDDLVIGHVGRFADEKNHKFIIDLFYELRKKSDKHKLLLVGDGELKESIESKVADLGLKDSVTFTGNVNNVQDYMQAMDLFILPSLYEGLPLTSVEAQSCGLPCVFSAGVSEEAKLTDNVEFVPLYDKEKWIETIEKMILLPKEDNAEKIRTAGYDINDTSETLRQIYKGMIL